jgi:2-polyprenyl-3-methyl-5-hydroxy-6-metoxy-1,4-benzoquinol methylase
MNSRIRAVLGYVEGPEILDVGCVGGDHSSVGSPEWLHKHIANSWPTAWGIDLSAAGIKRVQDLGYANVRVGDAQDFQLNSRFDTIVAGELIEHIENPASFLRCAAAHLKPEGKILLTTPFPFAVANLAYALVKFPKTCSNAEHVNWFCPSTMTALAQRVGLKVEHWELVDDYTEDPPSLLYRIGAAILRLFPRRLRSNSMLFIMRIDSSEGSAS